MPLFEAIVDETEDGCDKVLRSIYKASLRSVLFVSTPFVHGGSLCYSDPKDNLHMGLARLEGSSVIMNLWLPWLQP